MMRMKYLWCAAVLVLMAAETAPVAELATKKALTLEVAKQIAAASAEHARKNNWTVVISIVDDGGHLVYFERMDGFQASDEALRGSCRPGTNRSGESAGRNAFRGRRTYRGGRSNHRRGRNKRRHRSAGRHGRAGRSRCPSKNSRPEINLTLLSIV